MYYIARDSPVRAEKGHDAGAREKVEGLRCVDGFSGDAKAAETVKDGSFEAAHFGEAGVNM